jgi:hypothetical protein
MNILNFILPKFLRRRLPDSLASNPSVSELIGSFEETKRQLEQAAQDFCDKASVCRSQAQQLELQAKANDLEASRAARVAKKIEEITD